MGSGSGYLFSYRDWSPFFVFTWSYWSPRHTELWMPHSVKSPVLEDTVTWAVVLPEHFKKHPSTRRCRQKPSFPSGFIPLALNPEGTPLRSFLWPYHEKRSYSPETCDTAPPASTQLFLSTLTPLSWIVEQRNSCSQNQGSGSVLSLADLPLPSPASPRADMLSGSSAALGHLWREHELRAPQPGFRPGFKPLVTM